ncbi:hypothetical protein [uncultured Tateyamaria sp.]|uniref:hypothetical protein n=1 Tax=uncultured Tateyamaria sp. TaxID=455651 RepID=UPI002633577F|nr:hypothetical protein [uncultured Tateyamaria sp.]
MKKLLLFLSVDRVVVKVCSSIGRLWAYYGRQHRFGRYLPTRWFNAFQTLSNRASVGHGTVIAVSLIAH